MKFSKNIIALGLILALTSCSLSDIPFIGGDKEIKALQEAAKIKAQEKESQTVAEKLNKIKNKENKTPDKSVQAEDVSENIQTEVSETEVTKTEITETEVIEEELHSSAATTVTTQTPALLNRYKDMIEENSALIALKNNEHSIALLESQEVALLKLMKELATEFGSKEEEEVDMIYQTAIQPFFENLKQIQNINIYVHIDPNTIADLIRKQKLVKDFGLEKFIEQTAKDIPEGICIAIEAETQSKELKEALNEQMISMAQHELKDKSVNLDLNTKEGIYKTQIGCKNESIPSFEQLPEDLNIIAIQKGQITKSLEQLQDLAGIKDQNKSAIITKFDEIIKKLNSELNSHLIMKDRQSIISIFSVLPNGYKTQILESYSDPEYQSIRKDFFTGEALREEFFMNRNAVHESNIQTPNAQNGFEVYVENSYENIDWTHWIGRLEKSGLNAALVIPVLGISSSVAVATMNGYQKKAKEAERLTAIRNTGTLLKTARAVESIKNFYMTKEEVLQTLKNEGGYSIPQTTDNHCIFYASHPKATDEFLVFADGRYNRVSMDGTSKANQAISKFFRKNNIKKVNCEAPKLPGFKVVNLSQ